MRIMRKLVFLLTLLSSYQFSFACGNYNEYPLLEKITSGGYVPSEMAGWERGIRVLQSGKVIGFSKKNYESPVLKKTLGKLSASSLRSIRDSFYSISHGETIQYPDEPECMDAADTKYTGSPLGGFAKSFATRVGCRNGYLPSFRSKGDSLKRLLDGYSALFNMMPEA